MLAYSYSATDKVGLNSGPGCQKRWASVCGRAIIIFQALYTPHVHGCYSCGEWKLSLLGRLCLDHRSCCGKISVSCLNRAYWSAWFYCNVTSWLITIHACNSLFNILEIAKSALYGIKNNKLNICFPCCYLKWRIWIGHFVLSKIKHFIVCCCDTILDTLTTYDMSSETPGPLCLLDSHIVLPSLTVGH